MSRILALIVPFVLLASACAGDGGAAEGGASATESAAAVASTEGADPDGLEIVVTTTILGDLVGSLVGEGATVEVLMPVGADPHAFQVSPQQAQAMRDADLLVVNGLGLEEGMLDAVEAAEADGTPVFEATSAIEPIPFGEAGHEDEDEEDGHEEEGHEDEGHDDEHEDEGHDDEHEDDHDGDDPHFWLDPARAADAMTGLAAELTELDPEGEWTARAEELTAELDDLSAEVTEILSGIPEQDRVMVTNHEAFGYFADAFDMTVVGTVIPGGDTLAEPSAADLEEIVEAITDNDVHAIFAETTSAPRLAEVVAAEVGLDVVIAELYSDSLSDADGPATTYADFMRYNATTIADALG